MFLNKWWLCFNNSSLSLQREIVSKLGPNPAVIKARLNEINMKIQQKEEYLKKKDKFKPQKKLTRHEMDLEKSLIPNDQMSSKIGHLLVARDNSAETDQDETVAGKQIKNILKQIEEGTLKEPEKSTEEEKKEEEIKCVQCHQNDILVKYGHRKNKTTDCEKCRKLQLEQSFPKTESLNYPNAKSETKTAKSDEDLTSNTTTRKERSITEPSPSNTVRQSDKPSTECVIGPLKKGQLAPWSNHEEIEEIPQRIIERYRLTLDELKLIPRFKDYTPGEPSKVKWGEDIMLLRKCKVV